MNQAVWIASWSVKCAARRMIRTLTKILIPPLILLVLVILRATMTSSTGCDKIVPGNNHRKHKKYCSYSEFKAQDVIPLLKMRNESLLHYTPKSYGSLMDKVASRLGVEAIGYDDELKIEGTLKTNLTKYDMTLAAVVFELKDFNLQTYSIRMKSWISMWNTDRLYPLIPTVNPRSNSTYTGPPYYYQSGFLAIQSLVDTYLSGVDLSQTIFLKKFPHNEYKKDNYLTIIPIVLPLLLLISYSLLSSDVVTALSEQKYEGMKEFMKLNRLSRSNYWISWYMISVLLFTPTTLLNLLVLYSGDALVYSDISLVCSYLLLIMLSNIAFSFFLSCFLRNPMTSMMWTVVVWLVLYAPFFFVESNFQSVPPQLKSMLCLIPPLALGMGCRLIGISEITGEGTTWNNYTEGDLGISFQVVIILLLFDVVLYTVLAIYTDALLPGKFGYPQSWLFCLGFCRSPHEPNISITSDSTPLLGSVHVQLSNREYFEKIGRSARISIDVCSVSKEFANGRNTVEAVSVTDIKIIEGDITVILGPNGCGKSTLLAMIAGMIKPSEGDINVAGLSLKQNVDRAQDYMSYMPQHEPIIPELTVEEHLKYFTTLRGFSKREVIVHCDETLHLLGLSPLAHFRADTLSGGQKRKLSLAIALVTDSSILILDEPMAGLDIESKALVCSVLQRIKRTCTIVMCTHSVDDAATIADKIGIMLNNKLHCYGSAKFIKERFGIGFSLKLLKESHCQDALISKAVHSSVAKSSVLTNDKSELLFAIPKEGIKQLTKILKKLEDEKDSLGIKSMVISENTLEDAYCQLIFGKYAEKDEHGQLTGATSAGPKTKRQSIALSKTRRENSLRELQLTTTQEERKLIKVPSFINISLWAVLIKNLKMFRYHWCLTSAMIVLPIIFCMLMLLVLQIGKQTNVTKPLLLWGSTYAPSTVPFISDNMTMTQTSEQVLTGSGFSLEDVYVVGTEDNMEQYLLGREAEKTFSEFKKEYVISQEYKTNKVISGFGDVAIHSAPIAMSVSHNIYIASRRGSINIRTVNKPLPLLSGEGTAGSSIALMTLYLLGVSFMVSLPVIIPAEEISSGAKHLQYFSGLKSHFYWLGVYVVVGCLALVCSLLCTITVIISKEPAFYLNGRWKLFWILTFSYFLAGLPLSFIIALICKKATLTYAMCELVNKGLGFVAVVVVGVFSLEDVNMQQVSDVLSIFFMCLPSFSAAQGVSNIYKNYNLERNCNIKRCMEHPVGYLSLGQPGIGANVLSLVMCSIIYLVILLVYEPCLQLYLLKKQPVLKLSTFSTLLPADEGVVKERERVNHENYLNADSLVIKDLHKTYTNNGRVNLALQDLTIGVKQGETIGLLGGNGAGKSTTFRILTSGDRDYQGEVYYNGVNLKDDPSPPNVGYCPQFPSLIDSLSVRQHMILFARIKNQNEEFLVKDIVKIIKLMGLLEVADTTVNNLSLGMKKKLGVALALIGVPEILLLDEPSTGLDEEGKLLLMQLMVKMKERGTATLITSHNMRECEAICTRVGILTNGILQCLGSLSELKNRFGNYTLISFTLAPCSHGEIDARMATLGAFMSVNFPGAEPKDINEGVIVYALPQSSFSRWSVLFEVLETNMYKLGIDDYTVSQASLSQVYLSITRRQPDNEVIYEQRSSSI